MTRTDEAATAPSMARGPRLDPIGEAADRALHTHRLGTVNFTTVPHHIEKIGPRVFLVFDEHGTRYSLNLTPANARMLAMCLTTATCEAEALERAAKRQAEQRAVEP